MHHVDRTTPWDEIWEAFDVLRQQGKVLYFGSSNFAGWHIAQAHEAARARHFLGLVSEQSIYNLLNRSSSWRCCPPARHYGVGVIPWSPLGGGLLGGVLRKQREGGGSRGTTGRSLKRAGEAPRRHRGLREAVRRPRRGPGRTSAWPGSCTRRA